MLVIHAWPEPVKKFVLTGATILVIGAYILLCAGSMLMIAALSTQFSP